jgi:hypothetical protein
LQWITVILALHCCLLQFGIGIIFIIAIPIPTTNANAMGL